MSIATIPEITINGSNKLFGGYIYSARYNIQYESPSSLIINLISEDGNYSIDVNSIANTYAKTYSINIGSKIQFVGYLSEFNKRISPAGNTLELQFVDTSRILDILIIGLNKRHGLLNLNIPNLIIVGREVNPCFKQNQNIYTIQDTPETFYDPCHPCIDANKDKSLLNFVDCLEKTKYEILDVKYNFAELISKLSQRIQIIGGFDPNPDYLASYAGTAREVLSSWCQDFGYFYYWDNGKLVIKDLRSTINVNAQISNFCPNLLEYTESYSMRNSVKTATITNFSRPGDPQKNYECQSAKYITATTLVQGNNSYTLPLTITPDIDRIAAGLAYYNDDLRNLYYFYIKYQMYNLNNYYVNKKLPKLGMTIKSPAVTLNESKVYNIKNIDDSYVPQEAENIALIKDNINPFDINNQQLLGDYLDTVIEIKNNANFYNCVQLLDSATQWKVVKNPNSYFFFLAEVNESLYSKYIQEEKEFAQFLNKYAVYVPSSEEDLKFFEDYEFELDELCGINYFVNTGNISYQFYPSNVKFYNTSAKGDYAGDGTPMNTLPFAKFLSVIRDKSSTTSSDSYLGFKLIVAERGDSGFDPDGSIGSSSDLPNIRNIELLNKLTKYLPYKGISKNNERGQFIGKVLTGEGFEEFDDSGNIFLFMGTFTQETDYNLTEIRPSYTSKAQFGSLYDGKPINKEYNPVDQKTRIIYQYPELKCKLIGNYSFNNTATLHTTKVVFTTPLNKFSYSEPTDALFGIIAEKTKRKKREVKKVESFNYENFSADTFNYAKLILNYKNISDDNLKYLVKNNDICQFNSAQIEALHKTFSKSLSITYTQPSITKTFKIAGIDLDGYSPTIENGLISIDISLDSNNAVYSVYEFGTRLMSIPNESTINFDILNSLINPGSYTNTVNNYPLYNNSRYE